MAIRFGMTIAQMIRQLTNGFRSVKGRNPDGLELIKIQQEAVQRFKDMNKVVDMQGNVLDPSKTIMGGTQEGAALRSGIMKAIKAKPKPVTSLDDRIKRVYEREKREGKFENIRLRDGRKIESEEDFREYIDELNEDSNFAEGGRIGYKIGSIDKTRRALLKLMGAAGTSIAAFKTGILGIGKGGARQVAKEVIKTPAVKGKPVWFDAVVNRVIREGEDVTKGFATKEREIVHRIDIGEKPTTGYKDTFADNIYVYRDLDTGQIRIEYNSADNMGEAPVDLVYKPGVADEMTKGKPADEFFAVESVPESRMVGPDDFDVEDVENVTENIADLNSDVSKLRLFATGDKGTTREILDSIRKRRRARDITENKDGAQADFMSSRQGEYDYDPEQDFASGGIAGMLGE
tara:strand:- start:398 stop:1609 length:1212 start_codon:yes stop_codon:yes gene_type:complete